MKDQLAVRDISELQGYEEQIITTTDKALKQKNREKAIQRIEKRFTSSKALQVNTERAPGSGVFATKVFEFLPMIKKLGNQFTLTICDDIIEQELLETSKASMPPTSNDFLISEIQPELLEDESLKDERRSVLYRYRTTDQLPDDVQASILGRKRKVNPNSQLEKAVALDYVRDYVIVEKDSVNVSKDKAQTFQGADFLILSKRQQLSLD